MRNPTPVLLLCPNCLMCENGARRVAMNATPLAAHGPLDHERRERISETISYDYRCPDCRFAVNYPRRLT
mgnify:CR=1 FL=1